MKKSDLTRRALRATRKMRSEDSAALGFESGYRAARADLRREVRAYITKPHLVDDPGIAFHKLIKWLRPIR